MNVYVERFIQSIQVECLDHFLVFGEKHFDYLVREYVEHYHTERPHQGLANRLVTGEPPPALSAGGVACRTRLGGLIGTITSPPLSVTTLEKSITILPRSGNSAGRLTMTSAPYASSPGL